MFEIHTLRLGELLIPQGEGHLRDPIHAWYATDGKTRVLIDSGMPRADEVARRLRVKASGGGPEGLHAALDALGTSPDAIDLVILTHLHFDHAWNLEMFPKACLVVQRAELLHAVDPVPTQRIFYMRETLASLLDRRGTGLRLVEGDVDLLPGLRLMLVPGHTPGSQCAIVDTAKGRAALVSDLGDHYRCWFPANPRATDRPMRYLDGDFLPSAIRSEAERVHLASMARVRDAADIVVPAHDFRIPRQMPRDWWALPAAGTPDPTRVDPDGGRN
jgi:N-acyl homoserine lactone hydrolase